MIDSDASQWLTDARDHNDQLTRAQRDAAIASVGRRKAIRMAVAAGVTHEEIARILGVSRVRVTRIVNGA